MTWLAWKMLFWAAELLLNYLLSKLKNGEDITATEQDKTNRFIWYANEIQAKGVRLGCTSFGTAPEN